LVSDVRTFQDGQRARISGKARIKDALGQAEGILHKVFGKGRAAMCKAQPRAGWPRRLLPRAAGPHPACPFKGAANTGSCEPVTPDEATVPRIDIRAADPG